MFEHYGIIRAPLQYVQLGLFKHQECGYSSCCQICYSSSRFIYISVFGRPLCSRCMWWADGGRWWNTRSYWHGWRSQEVSAIKCFRMACITAVFPSHFPQHVLHSLDPKSELFSFICDAIWFISAFIVTISWSGSCICSSALTFSPAYFLVSDKSRSMFFFSHSHRIWVCSITGDYLYCQVWQRFCAVLFSHLMKRPLFPYQHHKVHRHLQLWAQF